MTPCSLTDICQSGLLCFLDFVHHLVFYKTQKNTFQKLDLFPSLGGGGGGGGGGGEIPTLFGPLERVNLNHWPGYRFLTDPKK
jgi:hypothetical protein